MFFFILSLAIIQKFFPFPQFAMSAITALSRYLWFKGKIAWLHRTTWNWRHKPDKVERKRSKKKKNSSFWVLEQAVSTGLSPSRESLQPRAVKWSARPYPLNSFLFTGTEAGISGWCDLDVTIKQLSFLWYLNHDLLNVISLCCQFCQSTKCYPSQ